MNKYEELACDIIDEISEWVENHYDIKPKPFGDDTLENPALINGVEYYDLESKIAEMIKELKMNERTRRSKDVA